MDFLIYSILIVIVSISFGVPLMFFIHKGIKVGLFTSFFKVIKLYIKQKLKL